MVQNTARKPAEGLAIGQEANGWAEAVAVRPDLCTGRSMYVGARRCGLGGRGSIRDAAGGHPRTAGRQAARWFLSPLRGWR